MINNIFQQNLKALFLSLLVFSSCNLFSQKIQEWKNKGNAKGELQDKSREILDYTNAIEIDPKDASAYFSRGYAKGELQDYRGKLKGFVTIKLI